jgi:hypothetical protein
MKFLDPAVKPPLLVRVGLWSINKRKIAFFYLWLSVFLSATYLLFLHNYIAGIFFIFASLWYYYAIKWVDNNYRWPK